jgi:hypothetical protein
MREDTTSWPNNNASGIPADSTDKMPDLGRDFTERCGIGTIGVDYTLDRQE